ncbi:MAG: Asp-tRNA(Asn)/Glu-tRNA(Gln) amidotransferase subunit GatC [Saprospiraceae bacterium]|nr:Asp-tRNA(Asn)/Glu-tRNA(Gln) amidotransferase subunit GatC [Saprospiraceae bacterium]
MQIDRDLILKLENLAKLQLNDAERERLASDMGNILDMVEKLKELDTTNVEPLVYISEVENQLRADEVKLQVSNEEALSNAPESSKPFFKVPKII